MSGIIDPNDKGHLGSNRRSFGSRSLLVQTSQEGTPDLARELSHQRKAKKVGTTKDWIRSGENSWPEITNWIGILLTEHKQ